MNTKRIKEIQSGTAYSESVSVQQALLQVWNECGQEAKKEIEALKAEAQKWYEAGSKSAIAFQDEIDSLKSENERLRKDGESITDSHQQLEKEVLEKEEKIKFWVEHWNKLEREYMVKCAELDHYKSLCELGEKVIGNMKMFDIMQNRKLSKALEEYELKKKQI